MSEEKVRSVDKATLELPDKAEKEMISTAFFQGRRFETLPHRGGGKLL